MKVNRLLFIIVLLTGFVCQAQTQQNGSEIESKSAVEMYRIAAEQGVAQAQYNLGVCYDIGNGVAKDYAEAVKWYRKAAEQGINEAIVALRLIEN